MLAVIMVSSKGVGWLVTETEINLMESGDWKLRALAGGNASIETAMTAAFTMRYFKSFDFLKRTKIPTELKSTEAITKLARDFQFRFDKTFYGRINQLWGIEGKALKYELLEENNIALWQYVFESAVGVREFNIPELGKLLKDTSYTTAFSSLGMSSAVRLQGNSNLNASVNLTIENSTVANNVRGEIAKGGRYIVKDIKSDEQATGFTCYMDTILRASSTTLIQKKVLIKPFLSYHQYVQTYRPLEHVLARFQIYMKNLLL